MKRFNCIFCGASIYSNVDIKTESAHAICDGCHNLGGRLPRSSWEVIVDNKGNPRNQKRPIWSKLIKRLNHPKAFACFIVLMIAAKFIAEPVFEYLALLFLGVVVLVIVYRLWNAEI